ncbi:ParB N-terminal domain-containing protein [Pseudomonas fuscovaginae UPB0736]|uniref:Chromosome partitioning protein, ParB family n=1 Tax=Pseudomonas asplenii TaxID=53407 RepID=A0A1H6M7J9_9PSED|nr:plasmid partitioning protein RepB C-terminal domain-containing protein [Pseudomonas fuscovaginae]UUQ67777.1 ParB N-terminal domain-containing protein [Pseudomonas fuscovaginae UPB0736]SEH93986.1 chromosome partitioning protein, ParB family [Pseudomonas fuscovaginae]
MNMPQHARSPMHVGAATTIQMVSLDRIRVLNPRARNKEVFAKLVENISSIGLKRPITVTPCTGAEHSDFFELVCGQGRYEAFCALGEREIPCVVLNASVVDRFLISLVENLARRKHSNKDLLYSIQVLSDRGYSTKQISAKTGLDSTYINGILVLLRQGEIRLIAAVEKGWLPITVATQVARSSDTEVQLAMIEAYETGVLKGEELIQVRRLIDRRRVLGKHYGNRRSAEERMTTPKKLLNAYQGEVRRQTVMIKKADINEQRLLIIVTALRRLLADEYFCTLLRSEKIQDMPKSLADRIQGEV